jgi:hypothetical protein
MFMSQAAFPNFTPAISLSISDTIPLLLGSIAVEELALAHVINAEAEKLQFVLGTLTPSGVSLSPPVVAISDLLNVNTSVRRTLKDVIKKEMLLEFKFENVLDLLAAITPSSGGAIAIGPLPTITGVLCGLPVPITGTLLSSLGTPIVGATVSLAVTGTTGTATVSLSSTTAVTNASGTFSVLGTFSGAGTVTITTTSTVAGIPISSSTTITVAC